VNCRHRRLRRSGDAFVISSSYASNQLLDVGLRPIEAADESERMS
jgi:hypothetical protein